MKIEEILVNYNSEKKLKVGAENGSAFFYCGTVGDFIANITDYSLLCKQNALDTFERAKSRLDYRVKNPPTVETFVQSEMKNDKKDFSMDNFFRYIQHYFKSIDRLINSLENAKIKLEKFKPLSERETIEIREADPIADQNATIMIITGYEVGSYWTVEEAGNRKSISFSSVYSDEE
jgi:hypothetical protein